MHVLVMLRHRCPAAAPPRRCAAATNYDPYPVNSSSASQSHFQHMTTTSSHPLEDTTALLHQTTVAPSQIQHLLRQATDIMADLHTRFLHHIGQADPTFHRPLPAPPTRPINLPFTHFLLRLTTTYSTSSQPTSAISQLRHTFSHSFTQAHTRPQAQRATTTSTRSTCSRLVDLKTNPKLRPNWTFVARRVGFSIEQCKARWKEPQDLQRLQDAQPPEPTPLPTTSPQPLPSTSHHISPTPTSPANTSPQRSQPDYSASPATTPPSTHEALPPQTAAVRAPSETRHPESPSEPPIGSYFI